MQFWTSKHTVDALRCCSALMCVLLLACGLPTLGEKGGQSPDSGSMTRPSPLAPGMPVQGMGAATAFGVVGEASADGEAEEGGAEEQATGAADGTDTDAAADGEAGQVLEKGREAVLDFYAQGHVPRLDLTLPRASWDGLIEAPYTYQSGSLRYGDLALENVGIRLKGRASFRTLEEKPSFKIKVNEFVDGQRFLGLRRLTLNNTVQDASMLRERLGFALLREAGADASLCNHAELYVNGEFFGLYVNLETVDVEFLQAHFDPATGNLYDISNDLYDIDINRDDEPSFWDRDPGPPVEERFVLETNKDMPDTSDLAVLIDQVSTGPISTWVEDAESVLDLEQWLTVGGVQAVMADWDGYFGGTNNYKIYHEMARDRFMLMPWGIDQTFGMRDDVYEGFGYAIDGSNSQRDNGIVFERCKRRYACEDRYLLRVRAALDAWQRLDMEARMEEMLSQVAPLVASDPRRPYDMQTHQEALEDLREFLAQRVTEVERQLAKAEENRDERN